MSLHQHGQRFSQFISGSTTDLSCVVNMLDEMLERSRHPDYHLDRVPPHTDPSGNSQTSDAESQLEPLSQSPTVLDDGVPQLSHQPSIPTSRSTLNRPLSMSSTISSTSTSSTKCSSTRICAWSNGIDFCSNQLDSQSSTDMRRANLAENSSFSSSVEDITTDYKNLNLTLNDKREGVESARRIDYTSPVDCSYLQSVVSELLHTERHYVTSLQQIIEGYMNYWKHSLPPGFTAECCDSLFGNLTDIYRCNSEFLLALGQRVSVPQGVAECFVQLGDRFSVYVEYCTNYPRAVSVLTELMSSESTARAIRERQRELSHSLPLGSHLLKPVQRILKYHLLLENMRRGLQMNGDNTDSVTAALVVMTTLADHINSMKRRHECVVRVQEVQSVLRGWQGADLTTLGDLVAEGSFRVYRAKSSRHLFLFDRLLLITKRRQDSSINYKAHISCSNLMLVESVTGEPLCFHVVPFDNPRVQYTLQARNKDQKQAWMLQLKRAILESYNVVIPYHTRQLVLKLGQDQSEHDVDFWRQGCHPEVASKHQKRRGPLGHSESFSQRLGLRRRARSQEATSHCSLVANCSTEPRVVRAAQGNKNSLEINDDREEQSSKNLFESTPSTPLTTARAKLHNYFSSTVLESRTSKETTSKTHHRSETFDTIVHKPLVDKTPARKSSKLEKSNEEVSNGECSSTNCNYNSYPRTSESCAVPDSDTRNCERTDASDACQSMLSVKHFEDTQYISFSDYVSVSSPLTRPRFVPPCRDEPGEKSDFTGVSSECNAVDSHRRMARSTSRQWPLLPRHTELTHLLTKMRRHSSLRRSETTATATTGSCSSPHLSPARSAVRLAAYLTPQLGKRTRPLVTTARRSGSLGRQQQHDTAPPSASATAPGDFYYGESLATASCSSSLAGSCESFVPAYRIYSSAHVSASTLRQMIGSVRSRLRLQTKQHSATLQRNHSVVERAHTAQHALQSQQPLRYQQHSPSGFRLMNVLTRSLRERLIHVSTGSSSSSSGGGSDEVVGCVSPMNSPLRQAQHPSSSSLLQQRPCSTASETTSCSSSSSSGVATVSSRTRGSDEGGSRDSCERRQRQCSRQSVRATLEDRSDSAIHSEAESDGCCSTDKVGDVISSAEPIGTAA